MIVLQFVECIELWSNLSNFNSPQVYLEMAKTITLGLANTFFL